MKKIDMIIYSLALFLVNTKITRLINLQIMIKLAIRQY